MSVCVDLFYTACWYTVKLMLRSDGFQEFA
jgi:hypothetical protein